MTTTKQRRGSTSKLPSNGRPLLILPACHHIRGSRAGFQWQLKPMSIQPTKKQKKERQHRMGCKPAGHTIVKHATIWNSFKGSEDGSQVTHPARTDIGTNAKSFCYDQTNKCSAGGCCIPFKRATVACGQPGTTGRHPDSRSMGCQEVRLRQTTT